MCAIHGEMVIVIEKTVASITSKVTGGALEVVDTAVEEEADMIAEEADMIAEEADMIVEEEDMIVVEDTIVEEEEIDLVLGTTKDPEATPEVGPEEDPKNLDSIANKLLVNYLL